MPTKTTLISAIAPEPTIDVQVELSEDGYQAMIYEVAESGHDMNEWVRQAIAQKVAQAQNLRRMQAKLLGEAA